MTATRPSVQAHLTRPASLQDHRRQVRAIRIAVAALAAGLVVFAAPAAAPAQTFPGVFNVDTTKDGNDGECNRDCTLREAVSLATAQGNSISLPAGVYKLTLGELVLRNNTTIIGAGTVGGQGAGARTTIIDAGGRSRVVNVPANTFAIIAGATITGGRAANGAGALVGNNGALELFNAAVDGNVATTRGGGVHAATGSLVLVATTISNNRVTGGNGGGIAIDTQGVLNAQTSTISGNSAAAGGGIASAGSMSMLNMTIGDNTGSGVHIEPGGSGGATLNNTIVSGSPACGGNFAVSTRFGWTGNLANDATCAFAVGEGRNSIDPRLGSLKNNKGPTDTMALLSGSPAIDAGDTQRCFGTDQRGAAAVGTCDIGAFEFGGKPPEPVLPPPVAGETVNVSRTRGTVRIKLPGSDEFFTLQQGQQVPIGSTFDTTKGRVNLQAAGSQKAWFYQGQFKLGQKHGRKPLSTLSLSGKLSCKGAGKANIAKKKKKTRRLWGDGKGKFRTKGSFSSATVRGTRWMVQDTCAGTLTVVKRGKVAVKDFVRHRTVIVKAHHRYFARRKK
jgi:CSLREA domain-containing protein